MGEFMNILITGGRSGIIGQVIKKIINNNDQIYISVRTETQLKAIKKIYAEHDNVTCLKLDITDKNDYQKLDKINIDTIICNAAIGYGGSVASIDVAKMRNNFEVNVFANIALLQYVLKKMIANKKGRIIMMSSLAGIIPLPFLGSYCATKASLIKLMECLKKELKYIDADIKVSLIEPGLYKTGFNQMMFESKYDSMDEYFKEELALIRTKEKLLLALLEKDNFTSITNKIVKAIYQEHPKFTYRAPFLTSLGAKIYQIFH